ncbi:MAG: elongation factor G [Candidatus Kapabacteria bacterium]|nr:elongation factor G [Ignavibacteriota bacterium]MCW5883664.1 elongation factor G [Candidatus Kapabacteria bacterium]
MKVYETRSIRNLAVAGHAGSGKTSLIEAILHHTGIISRIGTIEDNNTVSDFNELEHERRCSVFSSVVNAEHNDKKINIIDTPGYDDYIGEMIAPMYVCDTAMVVLNGVSGIEVGTENALTYANKLSKPVFYVINKLDNDQSRFDDIINDLKSQYGNKVTAFQYPLNPGSNFKSIVDILSLKLLTFNGSSNPEISDIPSSELSRAEEIRNELIESVAETNEDLMNIYFEEGSLTEEQLLTGLRKAFLGREIFPVFVTSTKSLAGISSILDFVADYSPAPNEVPMPVAEGSIKVDCDSNAKVSLFVFKMFSDPKLGDMTYFKVKSGKLHSGIDLVNESRNSSERFGGVYVVSGKKREEITELSAGDIGATVKLKNTNISDTLHEKGFNVKFLPIEYPTGKVRTAIAPKTRGEEEKVGVGLHALHAEDPTIIVEHSQELRQTIIFAQGELHLSAIKWRLEHRYKVEVEFIEPRVPYRETIQKKVQGSYRHKKQSGGAGQFAEVHMMIEPWVEGMPNPDGFNVRGKDIYPLDWGGSLEYVNCIVGGVIDQRFLPAILKGVMDKMQEGPLTGSYVRDIRVTVYDGKMHPVDSNEAAFKTAGMMVFKDNFTQASPKILEPIYNVEVKVPEEFVGDVMSDLPSRRGVILGIDSEGKYQKIKARMPLAELDKYSQGLRSMTQARATYSSEFAEYQAVPPNVQVELIESYKKSQTEEE